MGTTTIFANIYQPFDYAHPPFLPDQSAPPEAGKNLPTES
jgi:hypothetical protein